MPSRYAHLPNRPTFLEAMRRAGNNPMRLESQSDGTIVVWNNPDWPAQAKRSRRARKLRFHESN